MSKQSPPAPSAIGPCPTTIQIVGRPNTGSLPRTIAPPDHPTDERTYIPYYTQVCAEIWGYNKICTI